MASPVPITFPLRRRPVRLIVVHIRPKASQVQKVPIGDIASLARYERGRQPLYRAWLGPKPCYNLTGDTTALTGGSDDIPDPIVSALRVAVDRPRPKVVAAETSMIFGTLIT